MVAIQERFPRFTPEEYFAWEEQQELRHEYINGEVYAMTGGTINHSRIAANFIGLLSAHLRGGSCEVLTSDGRINISESDDYVYPDLSVTCDERDRNTKNFISHPCLIVEVLSPSTEAYDSSTKTLCERGGKFRRYSRSSSLRDYVLVNTDKMEIDLYHKNDLGEWFIINYGAGDSIELKSVDLVFPIEEVFRNIVFDDV
jgi:Uma2 family endonuclease